MIKPNEKKTAKLKDDKHRKAALAKFLEHHLVDFRLENFEAYCRSTNIKQAREDHNVLTKIFEEFSPSSTNELRDLHLFYVKLNSMLRTKDRKQPVSQNPYTFLPTAQPSDIKEPLLPKLSSDSSSNSNISRAIG